MRHLNCGLLEVKLAGGDEGDGMTFTGHGAVFGNVDAYGDVIEPGAFADSLAAIKSGAAPWPAMLMEHGFTADGDVPIGVWVDLVEDGTGLRVTGKLADTPRGREVSSLLKMTPRPAISGLSIGYIAQEWESRSKPEDPRRRLKRVDLIEISPVTFPANTLARVDAVKSQMSPEKQFERYLMRDAGLSRSEAQVVINQGYKSLLAMRDAGDSDNSAELKAIADLLARNTQMLSA